MSKTFILITLIVSVTLTVEFAASATATQTEPSVRITNTVYQMPRPLVEALSPKGLRVSIPDEPGIELFGFQGSVNTMIDVGDGAELAGDVRMPNNGRWTFYDKNVILQVGDIVYYWFYVQKDHLGYQYGIQSFIVTELIPNDDDHSTHHHHTTSEAPVTHADVPHTSPHPSPVPCDPKDMQMLYIQVNHTKTELANLESEVIKLTKELEGVRELQTELLHEMNTTDNSMLLLSGKVPAGEDPPAAARTFITEKLNVSDDSIKVLSAYRTTDGNIVFTVNSFENKLKLLAQARKLLKSSKLKLESYNVEEEEPSIDVRFKAPTQEELS